jgi:hypothetical protein
MPPAQKLITSDDRNDAQTLAVLEQAGVILFLVCLVLAGIALPYI